MCETIFTLLFILCLVLSVWMIYSLWFFSPSPINEAFVYTPNDISNAINDVVSNITNDISDISGHFGEIQSKITTINNII